MEMIMTIFFFDFLFQIGIMITDISKNYHNGFLWVTVGTQVTKQTKWLWFKALHGRMDIETEDILNTFCDYFLLKIQMQVKVYPSWKYCHAFAKLVRVTHPCSVC